jgi:hypothetical protein
MCRSLQKKEQVISFEISVSSPLQQITISSQKPWNSTGQKLKGIVAINMLCHPKLYTFLTLLFESVDEVFLCRLGS